MSVVQKFLKGGVPSTSLEEWKKFSMKYDTWRWAVVFPRRWCLEVHKNALACPVFHLLFGYQQADEEWHLLLLHPVYDSSRIFGAGLYSDVEPFFAATPVGLLPERLEVVGVVKGNTHQKLNLFNIEQWEGAVARTLLYLPKTLSGKVFSGAIVNGAMINCSEDLRIPNLSKFVSIVDSSVEWATRSGKLDAFRDASLPDPPPPLQMLELLLKLNPLLYRAILSPEVTPTEEEGRIRSEADGKDPSISISKLEKNKLNAANSLKKQIGECTTFSIVAEDGETIESTFRHVLVWQKPILEKRIPDAENYDPGPLSPQSLSAEIHMYSDRGEALFLQGYLRDVASTLDFCFDDYLHEEGELLVHLSPVEGVPFDTLDAIVPFMEEHASLFPSSPFLRDSCSGMIFPRVIRRKPSGAKAKLNPMTKLRVQVAYTPPTDADYAVAALTLRMMSSHVQRLNATEGEEGTAKYTLSQLETISPLNDSRKCAWCCRQREKLQRCSGCKVVYYCGKEHQRQDWTEGRHKEECKWWKKAWEEMNTKVVPYLKSVAENPKRLHSLGYSYAYSSFAFLHRLADQLRSRSSLATSFYEIHFVWHQEPILEDFFLFFQHWLSEQRMSPLFHKEVRCLLCSQSFSETLRNTVWEVDPEGVRLVPPTGVLGDMWREHAGLEAGYSVSNPSLRFRFRLTNDSYNLHHTEKVSSSDTIPDALLFYGPLDGSGMNYLSSGLEVAAQRIVGIVPSLWIDSSYVGCLRTQHAIVARVLNSTQSAEEIQAYCKPLSQSVAEEYFPVHLNNDGVVADSGSQNAEMNSLTALPIFTNAYFFEFPVVINK